jgi:hypothetical protein
VSSTRAAGTPGRRAERRLRSRAPGGHLARSRPRGGEATAQLASATPPARIAGGVEASIQLRPLALRASVQTRSCRCTRRRKRT